MFLRRDVAKHGATIPTDVGGSDTAGNVIVSGCDVGGERSEGVEGSFVTPIDLLLHVFFDELHWNVAGTFIHDLTTFGPGTCGELSLDFQFGQLRVIVGVGNRSGTKPVTDRETDLAEKVDQSSRLEGPLRQVVCRRKTQRLRKLR